MPHAFAQALRCCREGLRRLPFSNMDRYASLTPNKDESWPKVRPAFVRADWSLLLSGFALFRFIDVPDDVLAESINMSPAPIADAVLRRCHVNHIAFGFRVRELLENALNPITIAAYLGNARSSSFIKSGQLSDIFISAMTAARCCNSFGCPMSSVSH